MGRIRGLFKREAKRKAAVIKAPAPRMAVPGLEFARGAFSVATTAPADIDKVKVRPFIPWRKYNKALATITDRLQAEQKEMRKNLSNLPHRLKEIGYEQRKAGNGKYETIQRRKSDMRLFSQLHEKQQSAYQRIDEAYGYEMTGLPCSRMRYSDAPAGGDWELTPQQIEAVLDYREWRTDLYKSAPAALYAVIRYMTGYNLTDIEKALRIGNGKAAVYIAHGLGEYCKMKGWGTKPPARRVRITGYGSEISQFFANETDDLGRPVWTGVEPPEN